MGTNNLRDDEPKPLSEVFPPAGRASLQGYFADRFDCSRKRQHSLKMQLQMQWKYNIFS
jgi:hypothetical protein